MELAAEWEDAAAVAVEQNVCAGAGNHRSLFTDGIFPAAMCCPTGTVSGRAAFSGDPKSLI